MNDNRTLRELNPGEERDPARSSFLGLALILVLCLTVTGGCQQAPIHWPRPSTLWVAGPLCWS